MKRASSTFGRSEKVQQCVYRTSISRRIQLDAHANVQIVAHQEISRPTSRVTQVLIQSKWPP